MRVLNVELLYALLLMDNSMNAINSKNKAIVKNMKLVFKALSAYLTSKGSVADTHTP